MRFTRESVFTPTLMVPWPAEIEVAGGECALTPATRILIRSEGANGDRILRHARVLAGDLRSLLGLDVEASLRDDDRPGDIVLELLGVGDGEGSAVEFEMRCDDRVHITAADAFGLVEGATSLMQLLRFDGSRAVVPRLRVRDRSASPFRGLLIDVARQPHDLERLRGVIELCRFYKVRYLQLHLSDDEGWTFPSTAFPRLGIANRNGVPRYELAKLEALVRFAEDRGVVLLPEIDWPGHSGAMLRAMPELFDPAGLGNVNVATERVFAALDTLIGEIAEVFDTSPYLHFGADEVKGLEKVMAHYADDPYVRAHGISDAEGLFSHFMNRVADMVEARGKRAMAWEGHRDVSESLRRIVMVAWDNSDYPINDLLADGFDTVNAAYCPLYLLEDQTDVTPRFLYENWDRFTWGRYSDEPRSIERCELGRTAEDDHVLGAMFCSWENREGFQLEGLRPLLPAFAERIRNPSAGERGFDDFEVRAKAADGLFQRLFGGSR